MTLQDIINISANQFDYSDEVRKVQLDILQHAFETCTVDDIVTALNKIKTDRDEYSGIRSNLAHNLKSEDPTHGYMFVRLLSAGWEHHSGNEFCPILNEETGLICRSESCQGCQGCSLTRRMDLIDYMIDKLKSLEF